MNMLKEIFCPRYATLKFRCALSDYQRNIILKIIEWVKGFCVKEEDLKAYWESYHLPMPIKPSSYAELLTTLDNHSQFCIHDTNGRKKIDYDACHHYTPSIMMNDVIKGVDADIAKYQGLTCPTDDDIEALALSLSQSLILINSNIGHYHFNANHSPTHTPSLEEGATYYPNRNYFSDARQLRSSIIGLINIYRDRSDEMPSSTLDATHSYLLLERNIFAFSAFCGLMLDAAVGTTAYRDPLHHIEGIIRHCFHDAELYRLEFPASPVDTSQTIGSRGPKAHTTIMKLYLIDRIGNRVIVRIDLPHVRSPKFHLNIDSPDCKIYDALNHMEIDAIHHDDSLIPVLDSLKTSITEQMSHLLVVADTDLGDEKKILQDMEKHLTYRELCYNYLSPSSPDYSRSLKKVSGHLRMSGATVGQVLEAARKHYSV